jgi:hypothetical protein
MSFLEHTFDVDQLPQGTGGFDVVPPGWYSAKIGGAELKDTKAGNGQYISVRYDITGPSHQGRVVFGNLNIKNPNTKAEEIGRQQLGELMRAIGLAKLSDTDQLIGSDLQVKIAVREDEKYGANNDVKGFKSVPGGAPAIAATQMATTATSAPATSAGKASPPWAKK